MRSRISSPSMVQYSEKKKPQWQWTSKIVTNICFRYCPRGYRTHVHWQARWGKKIARSFGGPLPDEFTCLAPQKIKHVLQVDLPPPMAHGILWIMRLLIRSRESGTNFPSLSGQPHILAFSAEHTGQLRRMVTKLSHQPHIVASIPYELLLRTQNWVKMVFLKKLLLLFLL